MQKTPEVTIRHAAREDLEGIYECECACFNDPWSFPMLFEEVCENPAAIYLVMLSAGRVIGYCGTHIVLDESHITNVCVRPEYQGRGLAKKMMQALQDASEERGAGAMTLEVGVNNRRALRLYKNCGFSIQGLRKKYYNGGEDAYVMWTQRPADMPGLQLQSGGSIS